MHLNAMRILERSERVLRERIMPRVHTPLDTVALESWDVPGEPVPVAEVLDESGQPRVPFAPFVPPHQWGGAWTTTWFRVTGRVPRDLAEDTVVELLIDLGWFDHSVGGHVEALVRRPDGTAIKALHPRNAWVRLTGPGAPHDVVDADGSFCVYVEAAANPLLLGLPPFRETRLGDGVHDSIDDPYVLRSAEICTFDRQVWELARDVEVVSGLAATLDRGEPRYWKLVRALEEALNRFDEDDPESTNDARAALTEVLSRPANASAHVMTAVGHAHIDSAWLWPLRETRRKVGRTVANVLELLDEGWDIRYAMTSSQHYDWLESDYPDLYARLIDRVREGRIVPVGGMWIEVDGMLPTGESLVRQMTFGVRDMERRFGSRPREIWLPDSFGYSAALPQLARRAGFRWFLTQKLSWNDTTTFPHHTFWWRGLDGTRVLTHFPPTDTYAAEITAAELHRGVSQFREKAISDHSLLLFGYGDGGGGPTREMVGRLERFSDLEGAPRLETATPESFFERAEEELGVPGAPEWSGELYLELHRATSTTQVDAKQGNRRSEALLRVTEYLWSVAMVRHGAAAPLEELTGIWKILLLNQFHDILPGTAIPWVYTDLRADHAEIARRCGELIARALDVIGRGVTPGRILSVGRTAEQAWRVDRKAGSDQVTCDADGAGWTLDSDTLHAVIDRDGLVVSLVEKASGREVVAAGGRLGVPVVFRDQPIRWDAWDLDRHVLAGPRTRVTQAVSVEAVTDGGSRGVRVLRTWGDSRFTQTWWMHPGNPTLEMESDLDWREREHLLKVEFPLGLTPSDAWHETQYGRVARPIHSNTPGDEAQFESATHRFVRLEEPGWGVGLVNDGAYGVDTTPLNGGTRVRPSLVRSPRFPDPDTDLGKHHHRFAISTGSAWDTLAAADALNATVVDGLPDIEPLLQVEASQGSVVIDWVKPADDGSRDLIVRLYEPIGSHAQGVLRVGEELRSSTVRETDLLEHEECAEDLPRALKTPDVPTKGAQVFLQPFQVATLRIRP